MTKRSMLQSALLHICLILLLLLERGGVKGGTGGAPPSPQPTGTGETQADDKKIVEKPNKTTTTVELIESKDPGQTKPAERDCKEGMFYGGLGMYSSNNSDGTTTVIEAFPGYPASRIGLVKGDIVLQPRQADIIGQIGTDITLVVLKASTGAVVTITTQREKVCVEK